MTRSSAHVTTTELQNCSLIRIEGDINESFDPAVFAGRRGVVVFDLGAVSRVTSHGVLQWINALRALDASYYCFINCRPSVVDQFNLVHAFPQRGELVSFYVVFVCPDCGREMERLIDLRHYVEIYDTVTLPAVECPSCGVQAEFDEVPDLYFRYVLSAPLPRPPAAANAAIGGIGETAPERRGRRFEMTKAVEEQLTVFWLSGYLDDRSYFKRAADGVDGEALVDVGELEGISEGGMSALAKFLSALDERTVLARVSGNLLPVMAELLSRRRTRRTRVASFLISFRCTGCHALFGADLTPKGLGDLRVGVLSQTCPDCMNPLEPQWSEEMVAAALALPAAEASEQVIAFLRAYPASGRMIGRDRFAPAAADAPRLLGKYMVLGQLGKGGMGEVFLARQIGPEEFEKLVVLKRIRRDRLEDQRTRDLLVTEARIAARLSHPNIVQIFDLEKLDDEYLISMEYVPGIDLGNALQLSRELRLMWPFEICCRLVADLCSALNAAHSYQGEDGRPAPIIHLDVKPSNILLSTDGTVKLADFGIARVVADSGSGGFGTAGYAAPEQCNGGVTDERTDIYAAGVVLYECLTLRPITYGPTRPPSSPPPEWKPHSSPLISVARSGAPPLLQDIFERAVAHDQRERYRNARELGRDLERISRLTSDVTTADLAIWIRRLVALRRENAGAATPAIVKLETEVSRPIRRGRTTMPPDFAEGRRR